MPTLNKIDQKSDKEQHNKDTKSEELGENSSENNVFQQMKNIPVAGRPSETNVTPRRASKQFSRRNSVDDNASTLSLENFGGSQVKYDYGIVFTKNKYHQSSSITWWLQFLINSPKLFSIDCSFVM